MSQKVEGLTCSRGEVIQLAADDFALAKRKQRSIGDSVLLCFRSPRALSSLSLSLWQRLAFSYSVDSSRHLELNSGHATHLSPPHRHTDRQAQTHDLWRVGSKVRASLIIASSRMLTNCLCLSNLQWIFFFSFFFVFTRSLMEVARKRELEEQRFFYGFSPPFGHSVAHWLKAHRIFIYCYLRE